MSAAAFFGGGSEPAYWVSGTSYTKGNVRRSVADDQLYTRITNGAGTTDPASDATNWTPEGMRAIKAIQRGTTSLSAASTNVTISSVVTAKTELRFLGGTGSDLNGFLMSPRMVLTNSTTLTFATTNSPAGPYTVSWELTEYY